MKKTIILLCSTLIAGIMFSSCVRELMYAVPEPEAEAETTVSATFSPATKTAFNDFGEFSWAAGDAIKVEDDSHVFTEFTLSSGAGTGNANFSASGSIAIDNVAVYPSSIAVSVDASDNVTILLPATYTLDECADAVPMLGLKSGSDFAFKHLGGALRFHYTVPAGASKFVVNADKKINGSFTFAASSGVSVSTTSTSTASEKTITVTGLTPGNDVVMTIPLPTGTYSSISAGFRSSADAVVGTDKNWTDLSISRAQLANNAFRIAPTDSYKTYVKVEWPEIEGLDSFKACFRESGSGSGYYYYTISSAAGVTRYQFNGLEETKEYDLWIIFFDSEGHEVKSNVLENVQPSSTGSTYESSDYSEDGTVERLQAHSVGNGIDVILMGDGFTDVEVADGTYRNTMLKAYDAFFSVEPYITYKDLFDVYIVYAVSKSSIFEDGGSSTENTVFGAYKPYAGSTYLTGDKDKVLEYANKVSSVGGYAINTNYLEMIVVLNCGYHAGTNHGTWYSDASGAWAYSFLTLGSTDSDFTHLVRHEAGGHGFGKLADEYYGTKTNSDETLFDSSHDIWMDGNVTASTTSVFWQDFLDDSRYASEGLGLYEGGAASYQYGVWRPSDTSIMVSGLEYYNAPSRYAIYKWMRKIGCSEDFSTDRYEDFVSNDLINVSTPHKVARRTAGMKAGKPSDDGGVEIKEPPLSGDNIITILDK